MARVKKEDLCRWTLLGEEKDLFLSAMAKIYKEINKMGFSDKMGLTKEEQFIFNDVVEQLAVFHHEETK